MKAHFQNKANSSLFMWLNNLLAQNGSGFNMVGARLYPVQSEFTNLYSYAAPYAQFISDSSISGATVQTGIYLNNIFVGSGQSGFFGYNYEKGRAYFTQAISPSITISGLYPIKDYNISLTDKPEETILFETQLKLRPKISVNLTGLQSSDMSYPVIFIRNNSYKNEPFCFGGTDLTKIQYSIIVFGDSRFSVDAVEGLICDSVRSYIPLLNPDDMPYDVYGRVKSGVYNYVTIKNNKTPSSTNSIFIENVEKPEFNQVVYNELKKANPEAYFTMIRMTTSTYRQPRI